MAKLIIKNSSFDASKNRFPLFYVFLDGRPVGNVSGPTQTLEIDVAAGEHVVQIRSGHALGRSNRLSIQAKEDDTLTLHIAEKKSIYALIIIGFIIFYYLLKQFFQLNFLAAAGIGIAALYASISLLHPIRITQVEL